MSWEWQWLEATNSSILKANLIFVQCKERLLISFLKQLDGSCFMIGCLGWRCNKHNSRVDISIERQYLITHLLTREPIFIAMSTNMQAKWTCYFSLITLHIEYFLFIYGRWMSHTCVWSVGYCLFCLVSNSYIPKPPTFWSIIDLSCSSVDNFSHFLYSSLRLKIARKYWASSFTPTKQSLIAPAVGRCWEQLVN